MSNEDFNNSVGGINKNHRFTLPPSLVEHLPSVMLLPPATQWSKQRLACCLTHQKVRCGEYQLSPSASEADRV